MVGSRVRFPLLSMVAERSEAIADELKELNAKSPSRRLIVGGRSGQSYQNETTAMEVVSSLGELQNLLAF